MSKVMTNKPGFYGVGSVETSSPTGAGESGVRRLAISKDALVKQPSDGIETAYDILSHAARTHGNRDALGWRDIVNIVEEEKEVTKVVDGKEIVEKKKWKYFELSDYKYMSYLDIKAAVSEIGRGLVGLGVSKGDVFNVYAQTRYVHL
jgi:long-chain acyl-CoA synthetase